MCSFRHVAFGMWRASNSIVLINTLYRPLFLSIPLDRFPLDGIKILRQNPTSSHIPHGVLFENRTTTTTGAQ
jgi:hypothetical protein